MKHPRRLLAALLAALCCSCISSETDDAALAVAGAQARVIAAARADYKAAIMAGDKRERDALERELALLFETLLGAQEADHLRAAFEEAAARLEGARSSLSESRPTDLAEVLRDPASRPSAVGAREAVAIYQKINKRRGEVYAQLDAEREKWLNDPKLDLAARGADMLAAYARAHSEIARVVEEAFGMERAAR